MNRPSPPASIAAPPDAAPPAPAQSMPPAARMLMALLRRLRDGALVLTAPDGRRLRFGEPHARAAELVVRDWRMAARTLRGGDVGFAEAYLDGHWDTPDLPHLLTVLAANQASLVPAFYGQVLAGLALRVRHFLRRNTRAQARRNIVAHYDLGNAFYALWLDSTMTYSSALFDGDLRRTLAEAQAAKYERRLDQLGLPAGGHVLEIGCGWGGFAETAARAGLRVTGISLSDAQTAFARERLARAGLAERVELRIQDYRDVRGRYDAVASIEMIEAVGERWWPAYFRAVRDALVPGGRAAIQAITIADARFARYRVQSDFIQQYIFPGGMLLSPSRLRDEAAAQGLRLVDAHTFGFDYAATLRRWLVAFEARVDAVRALGFDARFVRLWRFYLAYCTAGFATTTTDVGQYVFVRER